MEVIHTCTLIGRNMTSNYLTPSILGQQIYDHISAHNQRTIGVSSMPYVAFVDLTPLKNVGYPVSPIPSFFILVIT